LYYSVINFARLKKRFGNIE